MSELDRNIWRPTPKQTLFLSIPPTIKEAFFGGGAGSGKSDVLLLYGLAHKWHENPRFKQLFLRRTHPELKKEIVPRSREIFPKFGGKFNQTDMVWSFPSGALIFLGHCEHENDVHQYDSMEISLFTPDEVTSLTEYIYTYIGFERTRAPKDSGLPSIIRGAGMPGGIGHTFVKKRFIDPAPDGSVRLIGRGGNERIYIRATLADNPYIDPTYSQSLDARPEAERKAKKFGDWSAYLGQVFDELRDRKYPDEPANAIHTVEPFNIPSYWPKFFVIDWGFTAMSYVGFFAVSPSRRLYLYREMYWYKTKIEEWAPIVKIFLDKEEPQIIKVCKSAGQDRGQEHTIQEQISSALDFPVILTNNNQGSRIAGKMLVHEYLRWRQKPLPPKDENLIYDQEYAMRLFRVKGEASYKAYLSLFDAPREEDNIPKLQIFRCSEEKHDGHPNCCPVMIDSLKACSYEQAKFGKIAEDVAEFEGDDPYDVMRYACDTAENFFDTAVKELEHVKKQEELMKKVLNDKDFTAFYRNSHRLDSENKIKAVTRYHHGIH